MRGANGKVGLVFTPATCFLKEEEKQKAKAEKRQTGKRRACSATAGVEIGEGQLQPPEIVVDKVEVPLLSRLCWSG